MRAPKQEQAPTHLDTRLIYVAGPFRGPTTWDIAQNVRAAEQVGLKIAHCGCMPIIPHANTHLFHGQCTDDFWLRGTLAILRRCHGLALAPNWNVSSGAIGEAWWALKLHAPIEWSVYYRFQDWCYRMRDDRTVRTRLDLRRYIQNRFRTLPPATQKMIREL